MKIVIFGTGKYYQSIKRYINIEDVLCFADNDGSKQGTVLDGKEIMNPKDVDFDACDYVLVLIMRYAGVIQQLQDFGVDRKKIKVFNESGELLSVDMTVTTSNEVIDATTWIKKHNKKKVLLVVHELTRNGVSVVMMHTAILLKKMGYEVLLTALIGGGLEEELKQANIDFISNINIFYRGQQTKEFVTRFDFSIMGTVGIADVVDAISDTNIPIMWWMHESNDENFADFSVPKADNIHYYAGGQRVVECFKKYYHDRKIEKLLYFLPEINKKITTQNDVMRISVIGFINYRKAQDVFISAVEKIPDELRKNAIFDLVGPVMEPIIDLDKIMGSIENINYLGEMTQDELSKYLETVDLLVCPSRDDPMPVVVTQAMQYGIPCLVSDQVGQKEYINNGIDGYIFESENVDELSGILAKCIENRKQITKVGVNSKRIFDNYFSERAMEQKINNIINDIC